MGSRFRGNDVGERARKPPYSAARIPSSRPFTSAS